MSVRGSLSTMPAEEVLEWVARRRVSAPISFERRGAARSLVVDDGVVVWASSNRREEQLGVILRRSGLISEQALTEALEARTETGVPLGKVLLMAGVISELELVDILATKIREAVTDLVTWTDGDFDVLPRMPATAVGINAQLPIDICLTVARRRRTRMVTIMGVLGSDDVTFYMPPGAQPPPSSPDDGAVVDAQKLWAMASDHRAAGDIAAAFNGERFATFDGLAAMVEQGRLTIDRRGRERTNSAVELAAGARGRLRQGDRAGALAMATQALEQDPHDSDVRRAFSQTERARVAEVAKQLLSRHRVPQRGCDLTAAVIAEHALTEAEIELAERVDGRWDLLSLVRSAPLREAEALLAFAKLAEAGVVELGELG